MIVYKYNQFISESSIDEIESKYHSIGEYITSVASNNEYLMGTIISRYTKDIDPQIELPNAINLLSDSDKQSLIDQVENYLNGTEVQKSPKIDTSINIDDVYNESVQVGGKSLLVTFMKCLTALGQKNNKPDQELTPNDFIVFYDFRNIDSKMARGVFDRFRSLSHYAELIDYDKNVIDLYFGIKCSGVFEYGVRGKDGLRPIGWFKLNQSGINSITRLNSLSAESIKKELVNLTPKDIVLLGIIKTEMLKFNPGYHEKVLTPILKDKVLTFGFCGYGKWNNGQLDTEDHEKIKNQFKSWLSKYRWCDKVLISTKPSSFWTYLNIKVK